MSRSKGKEVQFVEEDEDTSQEEVEGVPSEQEEEESEGDDPPPSEEEEEGEEEAEEAEEEEGDEEEEGEEEEEEKPKEQGLQRRKDTESLVDTFNRVVGIKKKETAKPAPKAEPKVIKKKKEDEEDVIVEEEDDQEGEEEEEEEEQVDYKAVKQYYKWLESAAAENSREIRSIWTSTLKLMRASSFKVGTKAPKVNWQAVSRDKDLYRRFQNIVTDAIVDNMQ
jgi:hypothetical protein